MKVVNNNPLETEGASEILLVEDDQMISNLLKSYLEKLGYVVYQTFRGDLAKQSVIDHQPDLILLDIGLPGVDGIKVCHELREIFSGPIMMLTSHDSVDEEVMAFNVGADDFLKKPVAPKVLKVRVEALFRRQPSQTLIQAMDKVQVGDITLYPSSQKCQINDKGIQLSTFEFRLLGLLLRNVGKVMSRDSIYTALLGRHYNGEERTVDVRVSRLREKLANVGVEQAKIETVWGRGYILNEVAA